MEATIKIMLNPLRKTANGKYIVCLRITIDRERTYLSLGHYVNKDQWDEKQSRLKRTYDPVNYKTFNAKIHAIYRKALSAVNSISADNAALTFEEIKRQTFHQKDTSNVFDFIEDEINLLTEKGKIQNANTYVTARNALRRFCHGRNKKKLKFSDIDIEFLNHYEAFLSKACNGNSISNYMRSLRAIFNRAISYGIIKADVYPFKNQQNRLGYQISKVETETIHRALEHEQIKKIEQYNAGGNRGKELARDMFMFSFYTRGMNPIDMAELKLRNIKRDRMMYTRKKTGKPISVKLLKPALDIARKYTSMGHSREYVFPIFNENRHPTEQQKASRMKTKMKRLNNYLKDIEFELELNTEFPLTMYVARHSWATILKRKGASTSLISEGLGHANEYVTQIYLDKFENDALDSLNNFLM